MGGGILAWKGIKVWSGRLYESSFLLLSKSHHPVHSEGYLCPCKCLYYNVYKGVILTPGPLWHQLQRVNSGYVFNRNLPGKSEVINPVLQQIQKQTHMVSLNGLSLYHKQIKSFLMLNLLHHPFPSMRGPDWRGRYGEFTSLSNYQKLSERPVQSL